MIEEARTNGSSALDLSRKGLTEIPASLFSLEGLKVYANSIWINPYLDIQVYANSINIYII